MCAAHGFHEMIIWGAALLLMAWSGAPEAAPPPAAVNASQTVMRQQIIIRVPARRMQPAPSASPIRWKEGKTVKCVPARFVAGATLLGRTSVDFILRNNSRVRAKLQKSCPALDYYNGFYISPNPDGMICADRDVIRSRVGGECEIDRFRALKAVKPD